MNEKQKHINNKRSCECKANTESKSEKRKQQQKQPKLKKEEKEKQNHTHPIIKQQLIQYISMLLCSAFENDRICI